MVSKHTYRVSLFSLKRIIDIITGHVGLAGALLGKHSILLRLKQDTPDVIEQH